MLVAKDGTPVFAQAYGLADRERKIPNTLRTRFRLGSMNKMFTAVATLQLAQAGKLHLDDALIHYLPEYPNKELAAKVTLHQLLTHTGGTGDIFGPEFAAHRLELRTIGDYVNLYGNRALKFEPGSRWEYSNYGFILLGAVIEKVSGESYYDYVRKHVYAPAGMTSTGSEPESAAVPDRSIGYTDEDGKLKPNTDTLPYRGMSAGGGYSTVEDLLRFANALQQHKLLDAEVHGAAHHREGRHARQRTPVCLRLRRRSDKRHPVFRAQRRCARHERRPRDLPRQPFRRGRAGEHGSRRRAKDRRLHHEPAARGAVIPGRQPRAPHRGLGSM